MAIAITATVTASSPVASQNAASAPWTKTSFAASARDVPAGTSTPFVVAAPKTVTSTASPSEPPTCCMTLVSPDAAPACAGSTPSSPAVVSGTKARPLPSAKTSSGPTSAPYPLVALSWVSHSSPRVDRIRPSSVSRRTPRRATSTRAESCEAANTMTGIGRNAKPVRRSL